jgi:hypothetical protein
MLTLQLVKQFYFPICGNLNLSASIQQSIKLKTKGYEKF